MSPVSQAKSDRDCRCYNCIGYLSLAASMRKPVPSEADAPDSVATDH